MNATVFDFSRTEVEYQDRVVVTNGPDQFLLQLMYWPGSLELRFKIVASGDYLKAYVGPERVIPLLFHLTGERGILALGELCKRMQAIYSSPAASGWINSSVAAVGKQTLSRFTEILHVAAADLAETGKLS